MEKQQDTVTLTDNSTGKTLELPILRGKEGPATIDVRQLYKTFGYFTYDPGFLSTASCRSAVTFLDGQSGILRYRGYSIEDLANNSSFIETSYLLLNKELPDEQELADFDHIIRMHTMLHEALKGFYTGFRRDAHPMAIMVGVVGALSAFYPYNAQDIHDPKERQIAAHRLIAKMPT
ncbi:MAG: citrate/2-methylcitrate synthase, partial [bacterium]